MFAAVVGGSLVAGACDRAPTEVADELAGVNIAVFAIGVPLNTVVVRVTGPDISSPLFFNLRTDGSGVATGTLRLPPGEAREFLIRAYDDEGNITHEGGVAIDVLPGMNPPINFPLPSRAGQVSITVNIGDYAAVVTPPAVWLYVGESIRLAVTIVANYEGVAGFSQLSTLAGGPNPAAIWIEGRTFMMGQDGVATPVHQVTVSGFWIQQHEVTNEEYAQFDPSHTFPAGQESHPVVYVIGSRR